MPTEIEVPANLVDQLIRDEALRLKMYDDSEGVPTIGVGHNLRDKPISKRAALYILYDDIEDATRAAEQAFPWLASLDSVRKAVFINMVFNMGVGGVAEFKRAITYVKIGAWESAAQELLDSKWATQVGARANRLALQLKTGEWQ